MRTRPYGYQARDLKAFTFQAHVQAAAGSSSVAATPAGTMAVTQPGHMQPKGWLLRVNAQGVEGH